MGRFLGKMALEFLFLKIGEGIFEQRFDEIRNYTRWGVRSDIWPIMHGTLVDPLFIYHADNNSQTETRIIYRYSLAEIRDCYYFFLFDIGNERYGIILDQQFPHPEIKNLLVDSEGNEVKFMWYSNWK